MSEIHIHTFLFQVILKVGFCIKNFLDDETAIIGIAFITFWKFKDFVSQTGKNGNELRYALKMEQSYYL